MRNDRITAGALLLGACLLLSTACKRPETNTPSVAAPAAPSTSTPVPQRVASDYVNRPPEPAELGAVSLLALRSSEAGCEWSVLDPPEFAARQVMLTYACPLMPWSLVWNQGTARSFFALEGQLYLHDWKAARVDALGPVPTPDTAPELGFSASGTPHVCDEQRRPKPGTAGPAYDYMVKFERDAASGSWKEATADLFDYDLGRPLCSGGDYLWDPGSVRYEPQTQLANNCVPDITERPANEICPDLAIIDAIGKQVQQPHDGLEYLLLGANRFLAYSTSQLDTGVSALAPLIYVENQRTAVLYDRDRSAAMLIAQAGDYFLIRREGTLNRATLFKKGEQQPQPLIEFPDEAVVMWIPGTIAAGEPIEIAKPDMVSTSDAKAVAGASEGG